MSGRIEISYDDGTLHNSVNVAGEFSSWEPVPLGLDEGTKYAAVFDGAEAGAAYAYKFIIDGEWKLLLGQPVVSDPIGNLNHLTTAIEVPEISPENAGSPPSAAPDVTEKSVPEPYEIQGSELKHGTEKVEGLTAVGAATGTATVATSGISSGPTFRDIEAGSGIPGSEPFEFKDTPRFEKTQQKEEHLRASNLDELNLDKSSAISEPYEFKETQLSHSADETVGLDQINTESKATGRSVNPASNLDPYELKQGELPHSVDKVEGLDRVGASVNQYPSTIGHGSNAHAAATSDPVDVEANLNPYEFNESQLPHSKEKISGLNQVNTAVEVKNSRDPYEFKDEQLRHSESADRLDQAGSRTIGGRSSSNTYELQGDELDKSVDKVSGLGRIDRSLDRGNPQSAILEPSTAAGGTLSPSDTADDDVYQDAYDSPDKYSSTTQKDTAPTNAIPGALPFENKLTGYVTPSQVQQSTLQALGGNPASPKPSSADQSLEFSDALDAPSAPTTGLESDDVLSKKYGGHSQPADAELDFDAAQRAVHDTQSERDAASYGYAPVATNDHGVAKTAPVARPSRTQPGETVLSTTASPGTAPSGMAPVAPSGTAGGTYGGNSHTPEVALSRSVHTSSRHSSTSSKHAHQPIDVTTGFPIDDVSEVPSPNSRTSSPSARHNRHTIGGVPTLRAETRGTRGTNTQPLGSGTSTEHRNAAVIAAATRASAYAKQDVANISKPPQPPHEESSPLKQRPLSAQYTSARPASGSSAIPSGHQPSSSFSGGIPGSSATNAGAGSGITSTTATASYERDVPQLPSGLERTASRREGRLRRFFSKLGR